LLVALVTLPTTLVLTARGEGRPTAQSAAKPAQSLPANAADSEKPEPPRPSGWTFNSNLALNVLILSLDGANQYSFGRTPSAAPLEIPAGRRWWVQPPSPVKDWDLLVREINRNKVPGLALYMATDSDLAHLADLTGLQYLDLKLAQITDGSLAHLSTLTGLRTLDLSATKVSDAGLEHLKGLTGLRFLDLSGTQVTGAGLEHLKGLAELEELWLINTPVTEAGLEHLTALTGLRRLNLFLAQITDAGLGHL
jgi:hypothetical protein